MINKLLLSIITIIIFASASFAETADLSYSGVGARPLGMGRAFTAVPDGPNAICFNPAGIAYTPTFELTTMQTKLLNSVDYKMYGAVTSTPRGNLGINYITTITPAGYVTTDLASTANPESMAYMSSFIILSYGLNMNKVLHVGPSLGSLSLGANLKIINNFMGGVTNGRGAGYESDLGVLLSTPANINFGISIQNFLQNGVKWETGTTDKLPYALKVGTAYKPKDTGLLLSLDAESLVQSSKPILLHGGAEWVIGDTLALRCGLDQDAISQTEIIHNYTYGVGLKISGVSIDYAYRSSGLHSDANVHYVSLSFSPAK